MITIQVYCFLNTVQYIAIQQAASHHAITPLLTINIWYLIEVITIFISTNEDKKTETDR